MTARVVFVGLVSTLWLLGAACASQGGGASTGASGNTAAAGTPAKPALPPGYSEPAAGSPLSKVAVGMNDTEVRKILGDPDNANAYMTGKAWIPFYYGPDTHRTDWMYKGKGRVVFSRNRWSGALKVIRVMANANEP
jgi:hypothetical protein